MQYNYRGNPATESSTIKSFFFNLQVEYLHFLK